MRITVVRFRVDDGNRLGQCALTKSETTPTHCTRDAMNFTFNITTENIVDEHGDPQTRYSTSMHDGCEDRAVLVSESGRAYFGWIRARGVFEWWCWRPSTTARDIQNWILSWHTPPA